MSEVVFITPEDARYGFSLAGTVQLTVSAQKAAALLTKTLGDENVAVVIVDERLIGGIDAQHFSELAASRRGVLVTLPAPLPRDEKTDDYLQRLIKRVLGYHVRLNL